MITERLYEISTVIFKLLTLLGLFCLYCCDSNIGPNNAGNAYEKDGKILEDLGICIFGPQRKNRGLIS